MKNFNAVSHNRARPYFRIQHDRDEVRTLQVYLNVHSVTVPYRFCTLHVDEAKRANEHASKRIVYWPPFWNKVYRRIAVARRHTYSSRHVFVCVC